MVCAFKRKLRRSAWSLSHEIFWKAAPYIKKQRFEYFNSFLKTLFFCLSARFNGHLILTDQSMNGEILQSVTEETDLGIIVSNDLKPSK